MIFLAKHPIVDKYDLSSLKEVCSGAAPLSTDIQNEVAKRIGKGKSLPVLQGYGMTELCFVSTFHTKDSAITSELSVGCIINGMSAKVSQHNVYCNHLWQ